NLAILLSAEPGQLTGSALASGRDWNLDGFDDLLVGVPGNDSEFGGRAGSVALLNGSSSGIRTAWTLDLGSSATSFGNYGTSVGFVGSRRDGLTQLDILIGEPGYDDPIENIDRAGRATSTFLPIAMIFGDGFESGDLSAWDAEIP
ncbi:MAG: integrin alpha, partial [Acidobacteriota bacterium]